VSRVSEDDVLFGYRLRVLDYAGRTSVSEACRVFGIHRSTFYVWKRRVERHGLEILRPRERRRPRMPQQLSPFVEERIVAFALGHPGFGPRRIASELARERWGGIVVSHNGVWRCLRRHGLNTRQQRLSLVAGYAAPYQPPREPQPERHVEAARPGELVGIDCFFVGRLSGTKGSVWQLSALDIASSYGWTELVSCPHGNPTGVQTSKLARRVARELQAAGWRLERVLTDNGGEFRSTDFRATLDELGVRHTLIRAGRPQTNGAVEAFHRLVLEECWRPAFARYLHVRFTGLKRDLEQYMHAYNHDRPHHGRLTQGRIPADIVYGANKVKTR
jgi:transposase InsO family protein